MADEQIGEIEVPAQVHEQVEHLRLDGDIQGRNAFVTDQKTRLNGQCTGDADACALATRKLVGVTAAVTGIQADTQQGLRDIVVDVGCRHHAVHAGCLADDVQHTHARIERGHGVLEDHLHGQVGRPALRGGHGR